MDPSKQSNKRTILSDRIFDYRTKSTFLFIWTRVGCALRSLGSLLTSISVRVLRSEPPPIGIEIIQVLGLKLQPHGLPRANGELAIELGVKRVGTMLQV